MNARLLRCGDRALLVEVDDVDQVLALTAALRADERVTRASAELVPAARTVLLQARNETDLADLAACVTRIADAADVADVADEAAPPGAQVRVPVRYDGPDLAEVAGVTGLSTDEVIARHTGAPWRAAFGGFAPGFAYLVGGSPELTVPRRSEPRTAVPAGSVALAGGYSAIYPARSPGGWQLIGTTEVILWDVDLDPPALIRPGVLVRFVDLAGRGGSLPT